MDISSDRWGSIDTCGGGGGGLRQVTGSCVPSSSLTAAAGLASPLCGLGSGAGGCSAATHVGSALFMSSLLTELSSCGGGGGGEKRGALAQNRLKFSMQSGGEGDLATPSGEKADRRDFTALRRFKGHGDEVCPPAASILCLTNTGIATTVFWCVK